MSKTKSLSSNGSKSDVREAATPSKKRKTARTMLSDATEPERSDKTEMPQEDLPATVTTEVSEGSDSKSSEGQTASAASAPVDVTEVASEATQKATDPERDDICPAPTGGDEAEAEGRSGDDEGADTAAAAGPGGVEISPTLHFVAEEPEVPGQHPRGDRLEISPTLPFDIDASALQEACGVEDGASAAPALPPAVAMEEARAEEEDAEEPTSEEDEEMKADTRLVRERAWLRHKRQMQAAQGQEDDDEAFGPVGRAPKRRAKASILMGAV